MKQEEEEVDHIVMFPFMAKGHTIPLLHLAAALSTTTPNLHITFITTPANAPFLRRSLPESDRISLILLPFPFFPPLPLGVESTDALPSFSLFPDFLAATSLLRHPFDSILTQLSRSSPPPLCLISDFFFGWTLNASNRLGIPRVVFHGMSPFSMAMCKSLWLHLPNMDLQQPFHVPGAPTSLLLTKDEIPDSVLRSTDPDDPGTKFLAELGESDVNSWGVLVNSFEDVEGDYAKLFESFYRYGARAWLVGPLCLFSDQSSAYIRPADGDFGTMKWLDAQEGGSVVYVSFGTQAEVPDEQLDEVAFGLAESGHRFLWAVRSETWAPPVGAVLGNSGVVVKWAPQMAVLRHGAVGGFVSHCGWNSVMEGASAGVPMLAWPMIAEQPLNAKMVAEEMRVGMRLVKKQAAGEAIVRRERVRDAVRMLMRDEEVRMRAKELMEKAKKAVADGGSSRGRLVEMVEELRKCRRERKSGGVGESGEGGGEVVREEALQFEFCPGQGIQIA